MKDCYLLYFNTEYNQNQILAGPLSKNEGLEKLRETVIDAIRRIDGEVSGLRAMHMLDELSESGCLENPSNRIQSITGNIDVNIDVTILTDYNDSEVYTLFQEEEEPLYYLIEQVEQPNGIHSFHSEKKRMAEKDAVDALKNRIQTKIAELYNNPSELKQAMAKLHAFFESSNKCLIHDPEDTKNTAFTLTRLNNGFHLMLRTGVLRILETSFFLCKAPETASDTDEYLIIRDSGSIKTAPAILQTEKYENCASHAAMTEAIRHINQVTGLDLSLWDTVNRILLQNAQSPDNLINGPSGSVYRIKTGCSGKTGPYLDSVTIISGETETRFTVV